MSAQTKETVKHMQFILYFGNHCCLAIDVRGDRS